MWAGWNCRWVEVERLEWAESGVVVRVEGVGVGGERCGSRESTDRGRRRGRGG